MRQITLQVPPGAADDLVDAARRLGAATLSRFEGADGRGNRVEVIMATVPNASVGPLVERAQDAGRIEASVPGTGVFAFEPPADEPPKELIDITPRSAYEVVLAGRQSAGSWWGFMTYAMIAGAMVWLGLYTETIYLLTGAMLIAPFAGPAMNTAIAINSGDLDLLGHSVLRYLAGILTTAAAGGLLTVLAGQHVVTSLMVSVLTITAVAVLLPLAAGVAGATFLVQSEHSSLISGAAVGILVAASLAPPAGGLGVAVALGRWSLVGHAVFLIVLQLAGITAAAVVVLWLYGIRPGSARFTADRTWLVRLGLGVAVTVAGGLVALQFLTSPLLLQGTQARHAGEVVTQAITASGLAAPLEVEPAVSPSDLPGPPRLVIHVVAEQAAGPGSPNEVEQRLRQLLTERLRDALPDLVPHVRLTVVPAPTADAAATTG